MIIFFSLGDHFKLIFISVPQKSNMSIQFRVRLPDSTQIQLDKVDPKTTVRALRKQIGKEINKPWQCIQLKYIFPPAKALEDMKASLQSLKITSGNLVVVLTEKKNKEDEKKKKRKHGVMLKKEIASDNSCLFNAVSYLVENKAFKSDELRTIIASVLISDPETYTEALLGKKNDKYAEYIMQSNVWGGSIELSILSNYYECEIVAIDVVTLNPHIFGENSNYTKRIFLLYDGIHYDALVMAPSIDAKESEYELTFDPSDDEIYAQALSIAAEHHELKQYTDVYNFTLKCSICGSNFKGQADAQAHAEQTKHDQFEEY
ncbi:hypothetical protein RFI_04670 [Reticulomyxa filosa]|uniref:Ubiquitin thioesterase OTU n=1 Tax=Reticulomyxa filosa TaxID=46433 RepID=X6P1N4_RETFI|nr:hypothetical protein RFI_04670 [Reticulomyxa filosa]|eukprot:ETO32445.1 hypothetical protein RFI_04670 [Reticulomyxa filosa]